MTRQALAGALAIGLMPVSLAAQTTLTIEAASADVHESPTITARVIGQAPRGKVLEVTREDDVWVTVLWPEATSGVAYVRLRVGWLARSDGEYSMSDVRADVEAVQRAIFAIWERSAHGYVQSATSTRSHISRERCP